jgi:hypothetical protein
LDTGFFVHHRKLTTAKRVEFVCDKMSYIILRGRWCNITGVNAHVPSDTKCDVLNSVYEELEQVFNYFPNYHMKILLGGFNTTLWRGIYSN